MHETDDWSERAIRHTRRAEMPAAELMIATRLLAGLPRAEPVAPWQRVAAAGSELLDQRHYLAWLRNMVNDRELHLGSRSEEGLLDDVLRGVGELVSGIEALYGPFPEREGPWRESGVTAMFLVEVAEDRVEDALWIAEVAHQASEAPKPPELVARMLLRAVGDDLREVERWLRELASDLEPGDVRDVAVQTHTGCRELADAITAGLPSVGEQLRGTSATESSSRAVSAAALAGGGEEG